MTPPAILMIILLALGVGIALANHGKPRPPFSLWVALTGSAIQVGLLYWGGFFG